MCLSVDSITPKSLKLVPQTLHAYEGNSKVVHEWKFGVCIYLNTPFEDNFGSAHHEKTKYALPRWWHTILVSPLSARKSLKPPFFFGLLNNALAGNRPQWFLDDKAFLFIFILFYRMPDHHSYEWLDTLQCYKRLETPPFVALFHFCTCHNLENLLISTGFQNLNFLID